MLMTSAMRTVHAPETDEGADFDEGPDEGLEDGDEGEEAGEQDDFEDGDAGDEGGDEGEGEPEPRQQSRGQTRIQRLAAEAKTERERAARLEGELEAERRQRTAGSQVSPEEQQRRREAHLATLTEAGRLEYLQQEAEQRLTQRLNQIEFQTWDGNDKTAFQGMCARTPAFAALENEVEQELTRLRGTGQNASRETIAYYLLGKKAATKAPRARTAAQRREQEGRDRQGARPVNGRGDVPPNGNRRTSDREARRKRLEGMSI